MCKYTREHLGQWMQLYAICSNATAQDVRGDSQNKRNKELHTYSMNILEGEDRYVKDKLNNKLK